MVHRLILSYNGAAYAGWQRQLNALAVQQVVEEALQDLLKDSVAVVGSSRTDSGVHARGQVAHLLLPQPFPLRGLVGGLNHRLPSDIRVLQANQMRESFHARSTALSKLYSYRLSQAAVISPLDSPFVVPVDRRIDLAAIREATSFLEGQHDFSAFALSGGGHRQPFRRIFSASWQQVGSEIRFEVEGEGFLRGMVRALVGTLVEVGQGRRSVESFRGLLAGGKRSQAGPTAPARGLVLERVTYPPNWILS
ncbi:MAG: tRNA pseudouridine(38-40) synthase TruA [Deltaproteobacteria bacterium]|nr:tRNA pseudouridine(38-40) synthase TruA [Deltaproteobacteria bacterium]